MPHSATVELRLHVNGETLEVSQVGEDSLILREARDVGGCAAELEIVIDGKSQTQAVWLSRSFGRVVSFEDR